jgi:hypothetical protein
MVKLLTDDLAINMDLFMLFKSLHKSRFVPSNRELLIYVYTGMWIISIYIGS